MASGERHPPVGAARVAMRMTAQPTQTLVVAPLEGGQLTARRCPSCNGHWIRSTDFWRWRAVAGENLPETPAPAGALAPPEAGGLRLC
ncbi:MAG: hypothetical protein HOQ16_09570 [Gemmatimonadaceae bacterium]|nr:hypothetical protein [Gemmatimonadaceae bacterium]